MNTKGINAYQIFMKGKSYMRRNMVIERANENQL